MRVQVLERGDETLVLSIVPVEDFIRPRRSGVFDMLGVIDVDPSRLSKPVAQALHSVGHHVVAGADRQVVNELLRPAPIPPPPLFTAITQRLIG